MEQEITSYNRMDIEAKVVCDAIMAPETIPETRSVITADMFTVAPYRELWKKIIRSWDDGQPLDANVFMEVNDRVSRSRLMSNIAQAGMTVGTQNNARNLRFIHADTMAMEFTRDISDELGRGLVDPALLLTKARQFVTSLEACHQSRRAVLLDEAVQQLEDQYHAVRKAREEGNKPYIPTGFIILDHYFRGGLRGGNVMVMAARPGVGKTATILSMIKSMVMAGKKVRFYSMEMPATELAERIMFSLDALQPWMATTGEIEEGPWKDARDRCRDWGLWIEDSMNNIGDILSDATVYHQRGECDIIFLDHLRLLRTGDAKTDGNIYMRTCEITRQIKTFALGTLTPVVYACQLNRDSAREGRDPDLQDLRDSGSIEEDADKIVFLRKIVGTDGKAILKMVIGKNRQGGGAYESTYLIPNDTYTVFRETDAPGDMPKGPEDLLNDDIEEYEI